MMPIQLGLLVASPKLEGSTVPKVQSQFEAGKYCRITKERAVPSSIGVGTGTVRLPAHNPWVCCKVVIREMVVCNQTNCLGRVETRHVASMLWMIGGASVEAKKVTSES